jgi:large subunit ribosomal protein L29
MKIQEIRNMNIEQLKKLVDEKKSGAIKFKFDVATKQVKNNKQGRVIKKDIARALTLIKELEK